MSEEGPKPYPVVYDSETGLQYSFQTGYVAIETTTTSVTPTVQTSVNTNDSTTTNSADFTDTTLTGTFALSNSAHKVLVTMAGTMLSNDADNGVISLSIDGTEVTGTDAGLCQVNGTAFTCVAFCWLYNPTDIASHTFTVVIRSNTGASNIVFPSNSTATLTMQEVI